MKINLGTFMLGYENVYLEVDTELAGGNFILNPRADTKAIITVGFDYSCWAEVWNVLNHEALEMALARMNVRFSCEERFTPDHASYIFVFDHCQFTEAVGIASHFTGQTRTKLWKEWDKFYRKRRAAAKEAKRKAKLKEKS